MPPPPKLWGGMGCGGPGAGALPVCCDGRRPAALAGLLGAGRSRPTRGSWARSAVRAGAARRGRARAGGMGRVQAGGTGRRGIDVRGVQLPAAGCASGPSRRRAKWMLVRCADGGREWGGGPPLPHGGCGRGGRGGRGGERQRRRETKGGPRPGKRCQAVPSGSGPSQPPEYTDKPKPYWGLGPAAQPRLRGRRSRGRSIPAANRRPSCRDPSGGGGRGPGEARAGGRRARSSRARVFRQLYSETQSRAYVSDVFIVAWNGNLINDVDCGSPVSLPVNGRS